MGSKLTVTAQLMKIRAAKAEQAALTLSREKGCRPCRCLIEKNLNI
ncbi:MAG: hypothetical protein IJK30_08660 [Ruminococcus sp.]|nr:hypothetical protein [Ruminococcus sp.]